MSAALGAAQSSLLLGAEASEAGLIAARDQYAHSDVILFATHGLVSDETPAGHYLRTKEEVISYHEQIFPLLPAYYSLDVHVRDITFLRSDVAIARIIGTDAFEMNGHRIRSDDIGGITAVVEKGFWKIAHFGLMRVQLF